VKYFGFTTFRDIDCTFYVDDESIELLPLKVDNNKLINKYFDEKDFYFEYNYWHNFINIAYVEKISHSMNGGIILKPKFTIENPHKEKITNIILSGLDIDYFFSPSSYFFYLKRNNTDISKDIIYNDLIADEWNIVFDDKAIKIELLYGNILNKGIASDLKLHPKIKISFSAINDYLFIYRLKAMIVKFLQVVLYRKRISSINTELWTTKENGNPSYVGKLLDHINKDNLDFKGYSEIKYVNYKEYISLFLDFVAKNIDLNIEHFPNESPRFTGYKYSQNLVVSIFSAFEFECRKNVELYEYIDDSQYKEIRKKTLNSIKEINCSSPEEEQFKKMHMTE